MSTEEFINEIELSGSNKAALAIALTTLTIGLLLSEIGLFKLMCGSLFPLIMILTPWLWIWDVLRKSFFEAQPQEYVVGVGWCTLIINTLYVWFNLSL